MSKKAKAAAPGNLNWKLSDMEATIISRIVDAAVKWYRVQGIKRRDLRNMLIMDITACHCNGCPLDLEHLLLGWDSDLLHDVSGIHENLDRHTGKLMNGFKPRYMKRDYSLPGTERER